MQQHVRFKTYKNNGLEVLNYSHSIVPGGLDVIS